MAKIIINLLPEEYTNQRLKDTKFAKIQALGVAMILIVIFLSSLTIALRVLQSQRVKQAEDDLDYAKQSIITQQNKQVSLVALKDRLTTINKYLGVSSIQTEIFNFLNSILPANVLVNAFSIDNAGNASFSAVVPDGAALDIMLSDLIDQEKNHGKVKEVSIESLNRGRDGVFRISLKIKAK